MLLGDELGYRPRSREIRKHFLSVKRIRPSGRLLIKVVSGIFAITLAGCSSATAGQDAGAAPSAATLTTPVKVKPPAKFAKSAKPIASSSPKTSAKPTSTGTQAPWESWPVKFDPSFQGSQLDTSIWATCYHWAGPNGCTNYGNTHDPELEWYMASQDQVSGGELHLVAQHESTPGYAQSGAPMEYSCRSGMVTSLPGFNFEYGYIQVTAQIPLGRGLWPALWLGASNGQWPPEVDILEHWHYENYGKVYLHPSSGARQGGPVTEPGIGTGWHTFGLYWTPTQLIWYYDGTKVFATSTGVPHQHMYLLMNVAVDQSGAGSCSGSLNIKSVKVWQKPN